MRLRPRSIALLALLLPAPARAELTFEPNIAAWAAGTWRSVNEGTFNRGNLTASEPRDSAQLELRPDWRVSSGPVQLVYRPRLLLTRETTATALGTSSRTLLLRRWSEVFGTMGSGSWELSYGLQNFQWGPAESASPSNRVFRDTVQVKDSLYLVKGHHLVRVTWAPSAQWSEVLLLEPTSNGDAEPEANEPHSLKAALKSELSWAGGSDFAGFVLGWRDRSGLWAGEYVNVEALSGLFLYADLEQESGSLAWYPRETRGLVFYAQPRRYDRAIEHFTVAGARYAFENGNDVRLEHVYQGAGYSTEELGRVRSAFASRDALQLAVLVTQASAVRSSGLDFPSKHYAYASARFPNAFGVRDWSLYARGLESLQDHSASLFGSSENAVGDHGTFITGLAGAFGGDGEELKGVVDFAVTVAYRHAW